MNCPRCNCWMHSMELRDFLDGNWHVYAFRCILCGEIIDPVIQGNRSKVKGRDPSEQGPRPNTGSAFPERIRSWKSNARVR